MPVPSCWCFSWVIFDHSLEYFLLLIRINIIVWIIYVLGRGMKNLGARLLFSSVDLCCNTWQTCTFHCCQDDTTSKWKTHNPWKCIKIKSLILNSLLNIKIQTQLSRTVLLTTYLFRSWSMYPSLHLLHQLWQRCWKFLLYIFVLRWLDCWWQWANFTNEVIIDLGFLNIKQTLIYNTCFWNSKHHNKLCRHHDDLVPRIYWTLH
jgi:hypothetical protein